MIRFRFGVHVHPDGWRLNLTCIFYQPSPAYGSSYHPSLIGSRPRATFWCHNDWQHSLLGIAPTFYCTAPARTVLTEAPQQNP